MRIILTFIVLLALGLVLALPQFDSVQREGEIQLPPLEASVRILRGDDGVPYVYADSLRDALVAQGFLHAQERLFQLELYKYVAHGRLAEFIGERGLGNDRLMRVLDMSGFAARLAGRISEREREYLQPYLDGINAYITSREHEFPLMLGVMGHTVVPWTLEDLLAIQYFRVWSSSVNWKDELLTLRLIDALGPGRAHELRPLNINPDDPRTVPPLPTRGGLPAEEEVVYQEVAGLDLAVGEYLDSPLTARFAMGSDAWATDGSKSAGGMPILSSDPHLDARQLPGFWYPMGLITPELRAVGAANPGGPGLGIARTDAIAYGATNGYADVVDLFVERVDPADGSRYLEGESSLPFTLREEVILVKDGEAEGGYRREALTVRETRRGPVISDHGMSLVPDKVLSLRWSVPEFVLTDSGGPELLAARSVDDAVEAIRKMSTPLNYVIVDGGGNIARVASGLVPDRVHGNGLVPITVGAEDNWTGRLPPEDMPLELNPSKGWTGTSNHRITPADYPYAYSTYFAAADRYRRLIELMDEPLWDSRKHWDANVDIYNTLAARLAPAMASALAGDSELQPLAELLRGWDYRDSADAAAPLVFQAVWRHFALETLRDDLEEPLLTDFLKQRYYWQARIVHWFESGGSQWFDDARTDVVESRDDIIRRAGRLALAELSDAYGEDSEAWRWGDAHTITFSHPFIPGIRAANLIGGGTHPYPGSGETLLRAIYPFDKPYATKVNDSLRMVVDLADDEKVWFHFPGGTSERWFDPLVASFLDSYVSGDPQYLWFSDGAILDNTSTSLTLAPR
jgi:penicillin amidase